MASKFEIFYDFKHFKSDFLNFNRYFRMKLFPVSKMYPNKKSVLFEMDH